MYRLQVRLCARGSVWPIVNSAEVDYRFKYQLNEWIVKQVIKSYVESANEATMAQRDEKVAKFLSSDTMTNIRWWCWERRDWTTQTHWSTAPLRPTYNYNHHHNHRCRQHWILNSEWRPPLLSLFIPSLHTAQCVVCCVVVKVCMVITLHADTHTTTYSRNILFDSTACLTTRDERNWFEWVCEVFVWAAHGSCGGSGCKYTPLNKWNETKWMAKWEQKNRLAAEIFFFSFAFWLEFLFKAKYFFFHSTLFTAASGQEI